MSNGITNLQNLPGITVTPAAGKPTANSVLATPAAAPKQDQTSLSGASNLLSKAVASSSSVSDVRFEKVAALQAAIADGTYSVSSHDVAAKIVDQLLS
ncbi:anti-sigma-28 factor, FlgM family [Granulicella rosea]|uniref:Negative regulator of flagellin synthesis n=1 Tax=Granulicella rosea TaxID=474952 RepID=A0A239H3B1_9BACT|nr:flagellar biosynthesis anti-sigma factor FlgM [Granulicella rosea]SNS75518.1 anti-sigma-28 factor, FlgM family [Granulicella rosea]